MESKLTTRRGFFQTAGIFLPMLAFNPFSLFRSLLAPDGELRPLKRPPLNPFVQKGKALVSVVRGEEIDRMVREAVTLIGGVERLHPAGKTVLVKPNVVSDNPPPRPPIPRWSEAW